MELNDFKIESPKLNKQNHHLEQGKEDEKHTERQEEDKEEEGYTSKDHNHEEQEKTKETTVTSDLESEESKEIFFAQYEGASEESLISDLNDDLNKYECSECKKTFNNSTSLKRHKRTLHEGISYPCEYCDRKMTQLCHLKNHIARVHSKETVSQNYIIG